MSLIKPIAETRPTLVKSYWVDGQHQRQVYDYTVKEWIPIIEEEFRAINRIAKRLEAPIIINPSLGTRFNLGVR